MESPVSSRDVDDRVRGIHIENRVLIDQRVPSYGKQSL